MKFCNHLFIFHQKQKQIWFQVIKQYCFQFVFTQFEAADNSPCRGDRWASNYWNEWVRYCFSSCLFPVGYRDLFCMFTPPVPLVRSWGSPQIRRFCGLFFLVQDPTLRHLHYTGKMQRRRWLHMRLTRKKQIPQNGFLWWEKQTLSKIPFCHEKFNHFQLDLSPYFADCFSQAEWLLISVGFIRLGLTQQWVK